jgi:Fe-S oxidoreductase
MGLFRFKPAATAVSQLQMVVVVVVVIMIFCSCCGGGGAFNMKNPISNKVLKSSQ